jgi:taurine dioxygenase
MNYKIYDNGWVVEIDIDLKHIDQNNALKISELCKKYPLVIAKKQKLTPTEEYTFLKMFPLIPFEDNLYLKSDDYRKIIVPNSEGYLIRVTGAKDEYGNDIGTFGWTEGTPWHSDNPYPHPQRIITYLYAIEGAAGSITLWANTKLAIENLNDDLREKLKKAYINVDKYTPTGHESEKYLPVYDENREGNYLLPFFQINHFKDMAEDKSAELKAFLNEFCVRDEYVYRHAWEDGDLLLANQTLGNHKRIFFDKMENRVLHKSCFGFIK